METGVGGRVENGCSKLGGDEDMHDEQRPLSSRQASYRAVLSIAFIKRQGTAGAQP